MTKFKFGGKVVSRVHRKTTSDLRVQTSSEVVAGWVAGPVHTKWGTVTVWSCGLHYKGPLLGQPVGGGICGTIMDVYMFGRGSQWRSLEAFTVARLPGIAAKFAEYVFLKSSQAAVPTLDLGPANQTTLDLADDAIPPAFVAALGGQAGLLAQAVERALSDLGAERVASNGN